MAAFADLMSLCIGMAGVIGSLVTFQDMRIQVNEKLPASLRIGPFDLSHSRTEIFDLHRQFYPESTLRQRYWWFAATILLSGVLQFLLRRHA